MGDPRNLECRPRQGRKRDVRGEGGEWESGGGKVAPTRLREVQAFSKFLRLDQLGIVALEASRIWRFRLVGNSIRST